MRVVDLYFISAAMRVEFQIRRDGLKSHGIDSVQDYFDRQNSLGRYLTTEWLRLTLDHVAVERVIVTYVH